MLRILMVTNLFHPLTGGSENVVLEISRRLAQRGHDVHILTERTQPDWLSYEHFEGIHIHRCPVRFGHPAVRFGSGVVNAARLFKKLAAERSFDVLHFHLTLPSVGVLLCRQSRASLKIASFYGPWGEEERVEQQSRKKRGAGAIKASMFEILQRFVLRRSQRLIVLSRFSQQQVIEMLNHPPPIQLIPAGADTVRFHPAENRKMVKDRLNLPLDMPVLLTVRRLVPRMGLDALIDAISVILSRGRRITLVIGGDGPLRSELERQAASLGIQDHVVFTGFIPAGALPAYFQAADLYILPTRALEGFGLTTLESLSCGTPVLGTRIGATAEILRDLDSRLLIPESTPESIADTAIACLDADIMDASFRAQCRRYVEARFTWPRAVDQTEAVYRDVAANHAPC